MPCLDYWWVIVHVFLFPPKIGYIVNSGSSKGSGKSGSSKGSGKSGSGSCASSRLQLTSNWVSERCDGGVSDNIPSSLSLPGVHWSSDRISMSSFTVIGTLSLCCLFWHVPSSVPISRFD